jgi:hypothetical protein
VLHLRGTLDHGEVRGTKTGESQRSVDVPRELLDALAVHQIAYPPVDPGFVFRQPDGKPFDPDRWHKAVGILT